MLSKWSAANIGLEGGEGRCLTSVIVRSMKLRTSRRQALRDCPRAFATATTLDEGRNGSGRQAQEVLDEKLPPHGRAKLNVPAQGGQKTLSLCLAHKRHRTPPFVPAYGEY